MFENIYLPTKGRFLVSAPFLDDPNFQRTVVILVEHTESAGSMGFVLNKKLNIEIHQIFKMLPPFEAPIYLGGPVGQNTLHFIHKVPERINGGIEIANGLFWGGDFEEIKSMITLNLLKPEEIVFFIGYSGWHSGQLESEIEHKSWIVAPENPALVFHSTPQSLWREVLKSMDGYKHLSNYPLDPTLN